MVAFYVEQYNSVVPHFAFQGETPDEMYFGTGSNVPFGLKEKRATARAAIVMMADDAEVTDREAIVEALADLGDNDTGARASADRFAWSD